MLPDPPRPDLEGLLDSKQSSVQTSAETFWQFDRLFVGYQMHYIPNTVINSCATIAGLKMVLNLKPELSREITLHVIRQLPTNRIAIDL